MADLYNTIISEMRICDREIRKANEEIIRLKEHRECYSDRKIVLEDLRDRFKKENDNGLQSI